MIEIHRGSPAFDEIREGIAPDGTYKISIDVRADGIAVKVNEGMWTSTLAITAPPRTTEGN